MKKIYLLLLIVLTAFTTAFSQTGQWTWMSGDSVARLNVSPFQVDPYSAYGTLGVPSVNNKPPARSEPLSWTDKEGNLWMYGGYIRITDVPFRSNGFYNDMWRYNPSTNEWTWMSGGNRASTSASGLIGAASWTDKEGNFWRFGGRGSDGRYSVLYDGLWKYNPVTNSGWTYVKGRGAGISGAISRYGTQGVPSATNYPGAREYAVSWTDAEGRLWLYGGSGTYRVENNNPQLFSPWKVFDDVWRYDPASNEWTWMRGDTLNPFPSAVYGRQGVPSVNNTPGFNATGVGWTRI